MRWESSGEIRANCSPGVLKAIHPPNGGVRSGRSGKEGVGVGSAVNIACFSSTESSGKDVVSLVGVAAVGCKVSGKGVRLAAGVTNGVEGG
jgi:hypothetical protein